MKRRRTRKKEPKEVESLDSSTAIDDVVVEEAAVDEEEDDDDDADDATPPPSRFQTSQRVLARDTDGLLYIAFIRRVHFGEPHQVQWGVLRTLESQEDENFLGESEDMSPPIAQWFYFVHFDGWKPNWDRWLLDENVLEYNDEHLEWQRRIQMEHKSLMKQHKQGGRKKVDGAGFLKAWKKALEGLMKELQGKGDDQKNKKKKDNQVRSERKKRKVMNNEDLLDQEVTMRKQHLITRSSLEREQIQLPSGLKRILVEEWEILTGPFGMLHSLDPQVSVRQVLDDYVRSKGFPVKKSETQSETTTPTVPPIDDGLEENSPDSQQEHTSSRVGEQKEEEQQHQSEEEINRREKEWMDMKNGICLLFHQALPTRLLYPREKVQLYSFLEIEKERRTTSSSSSTTTPNDPPPPPPPHRHPPHDFSTVYGCAHLLRLCLQLPSLLTAQYDSKDDDLQQFLVRPMLAKMNDLLRFLQIHQEKYFPQNFRKLTVEEEKLEQKWIKRYERNERKID